MTQHHLWRLATQVLCLASRSYDMNLLILLQQGHSRRVLISFQGVWSYFKWLFDLTSAGFLKEEGF